MKQPKAKKAKPEDKVKGEAFRRVDSEKWRSTIKDDRLLNNSHEAKKAFGASVGDTWGDKAGAGPA